MYRRKTLTSEECNQLFNRGGTTIKTIYQEEQENFCIKKFCFYYEDKCPLDSCMTNIGRGRK